MTYINYICCESLQYLYKYKLKKKLNILEPFLVNWRNPRPHFDVFNKGFLTMANLRQAASRIRSYAELEFRLCWMKLCSSDNYYSAASITSIAEFFNRKKESVIIIFGCFRRIYLHLAWSTFSVKSGFTFFIK